MKKSNAASLKESPLFDYPPQSAFNKILPKNKIYLHARPSRKVQQLFTNEIAQIVWKFKLAPETTNLSATAEVPEIQVFSIALKDTEAVGISEDILRCIDRAIAFPIFFEITAGPRIRVAASFKRPSEADYAKWVVGDYYLSPWLAESSARSALPVVLNLSSLYENMLQRLMPLAARPKESLKDHAERLNQIRLLEREAQKLETHLLREKQFNRKVEVNRELRAVQRQLKVLQSPAAAATEKTKH